jgi:hypothetical protein
MKPTYSAKEILNLIWMCDTAEELTAISNLVKEEKKRYRKEDLRYILVNFTLRTESFIK